MPYLLGEYRERATSGRLCRPYRDRTGVLLIESQASVPLLRRPKIVRVCPSPASNRDPPGFQPGALPPELGGQGCVEQRGLEPLASGLPNRRSTAELQPQDVRSPGIEPGLSCSQSRRVTQLPRSGSPTPGSPRGEGRRGWASFVMPSAVEFSNISTTGMPEWLSHGRQESNPQHTALETVALPN